MDHIRLEEQVKDILEPVLMAYIGNFNRQLTAQSPQYKVVIGGGSAINYYFKEEEVPVFKTHDFDMRCVYDGYVEPARTAEVDNNLRAIQTIFINEGVQTLNILALNNWDAVFGSFAERIRQIVPDFEFRSPNPGRNIFFSLATPNPFLRTINYYYFMNGVEHIASIVDLIIYSRSFLPHYGLFNFKDDGTPYTLEERLDMYRTDAGAGFVRYYLDSADLNKTIVRDGDIYYISLGFLLWDTVRVMNWYARRGSVNNKYGRYIDKYTHIINAFNDPRRFLRCDSVPMRDYCQNC